MNKVLLLIAAASAILWGCASPPQQSMGANAAMPVWEGPWGDHH